MKYVVGKMPLVVMKFVGAKYGNKNVKMMFGEKWCYVVMKYIGGNQSNEPTPSPHHYWYWCKNIMNSRGMPV